MCYFLSRGLPTPLAKPVDGDTASDCTYCKRYIFRLLFCDRRIFLDRRKMKALEKFRSPASQAMPPLSTGGEGIGERKRCLTRHLVFNGSDPFSLASCPTESVRGSSAVSADFGRGDVQQRKYSASLPAGSQGNRLCFLCYFLCTSKESK